MFRILLCLALAFAAPLAHADRLVMKNGDQLSGEIEHVRDGKAALHTAYAGRIEVALEEVERIEFDAPVFLTRDDGEAVEGRPAFHDGQWFLAAPDGDEREAIDPPAAVTRTLDTPETATPKTWDGAVEMAGSWRTGESDVFNAALTLNAGRHFGKDRLSLAASAGYGEVDGEMNTRRVKGEARYQHYPNDRWYVYFLTGLEHDKPRKLELRASGAAGLGWHFVQKPRIELSGDAGLELAYERWRRYSDAERDALQRTRRESAYRLVGTALSDLEAGSLTVNQALQTFQAVQLASSGVDNLRIDRSARLRLALLYKQTLFSNATLTENLTVWPDLENWGDYRVLSELALTTPLSAALDLRLSLKTQYESTPSENVDKWDHLLQGGVVYRF